MFSALLGVFCFLLTIRKNANLFRNPTAKKHPLGEKTPRGFEADINYFSGE